MIQKEVWIFRRNGNALCPKLLYAGRGKYLDGWLPAGR